MGPNKTYKLLHRSENHKLNKKMAYGLGENNANDVANMVLISKIYKQFIQLNNNNKKINQKMTEDLNRHFSR